MRVNRTMQFPLSYSNNNPSIAGRTIPHNRSQSVVFAMSASNPRSMDSHSFHGSSGKKQSAAAAERNQEPILQVLKSYLPTTPQSLSSTTVLEVASGTGQHAAFFASSFPHLTFQPSEAAEDAFESIIAWAQDHPNVALPPLLLDAAAPSASWPVPDATCIAVLCVNMTHISPFQATIGLLAGCGRVLTPQTGRLFLYGPFTIEGVPTTESNASFDAMLRARNPEWGLRDVGAVDEQAERVGLQREAMIEMPANNFILVYRRDC